MMTIADVVGVVRVDYERKKAPGTYVQGYQIHFVSCEPDKTGNYVAENAYISDANLKTLSAAMKTDLTPHVHDKFVITYSSNNYGRTVEGLTKL